MSSSPQDPFLIDEHKLHFHADRVAMWQKDPLHTYPIYVEISPVGHCNHRCIAGDTLVNTIDGPIAIKDLVGRNSVPVYTYSQDTKEVFITDAINIRLVGKMEDVVRVHFTDGTHLDCTPDHKLLEIGLGSFKQEECPKEAQYFNNGDRVKALKIRYNDAGYAEVQWGRYGKRKRYRLIMDYLRGYKLSRKEQVHHIDHNKGNDVVSNLKYCASAKEHTLLHPEITARMRNNNPTKNGLSKEWRARITKAITGKKRSLKQRLNYRASKLGPKNPNYKGLPATGRTRIKEVNHVVYKVERIPREDVYCMEVPATGWFFANDVLVKNCTFCAVDYIGYKPRSLDTLTLCQRFTEMAIAGVKSVMFAGEGEPLLHKDICMLVRAAYNNGLDVAFTTNGVLLDKLYPVLDQIKWIKVSLNAGDEETYASIHKAKKDDWGKVWGNLAGAVARRKAGTTAIGVQAVVLPDNIESMAGLVAKARDTGLDYVVLKPYSQHNSSTTTTYKDTVYTEQEALFKSLTEQSSSSFKVIARSNAIGDKNVGRHSYTTCNATPYFWAYVMATGDVYSCSAYLLNEKFRLGNINEQSFEEIWLGEKRRQHIEDMKTLDITQCRLNCRMNQVNKYLANIQAGNPHSAFI